ncbi:MAG TPA: GNAT family N-acetyltransferase [Candidatus Binatia bacterium]|jgi:GNAT superfamily N-acetyltransferase
MSDEGDIIIRRAAPADATMLGRLGAALVRVHHEFDRERFLPAGANIESGYGHFLESELRDDAVVILVAERAGGVVGYVYAGIEPRSWKELRDVAGFVHDVFVEPDARNRGVGARLVAAAADWLASRGMARVMLWTAERNTRAQSLFARLGFRRTMIEMTREVPSPGRSEDEGV